MLELWGIEISKEGKKIKLKIGEELLELEGNWEALYGIGNPDPSLAECIMFKFPHKVLLGSGERNVEFWFYPDLILKAEGRVIKVIPKDLKYSLYGDVSEGIIVRRVRLYEESRKGMSTFRIKMKNEFGKGIEVSKVVVPIKWIEGWKESPEEFSVELYLRIKGMRGGEVEPLRRKKAKYEMLWGFS